MQIPEYTPRQFGRLGTWQMANWTMKVYGIAAETPYQDTLLDRELICKARDYVEANLARMNGTEHYSTGFVILHHGSGAKSLLTQWWTNECVCMQHVAQSAYRGPPNFVEAKSDLMACAYELVPIDFERRAWISTVMAGKSMKEYLDAWLPDGTY